MTQYITDSTYQFATINGAQLHFWVDGINRPPDQLDPAMRAKAVAMNTLMCNLPQLKGVRQPLDPPAITPPNRNYCPNAGDCGRRRPA